MTTAARHPRITVAIPLHRSARFVDIVSANIERITADDVEILVSDRTRCDDTLEVLRQRHESDSRVTFLCSTDNLDGAEYEDPYLPELQISLGDRSRAREAMALLEHWNLGVLLRGLVRRDEILRRRLTVRHNHGDVASAHRAR